MAAIATPYNKPVLPRTTDGSDLGSNRASIYSGKGLSFDGVNDEIIVSGFTVSGSTRTLSYYFKTSISSNERVWQINSGGNYFNSTVFNGKINTYDGVNGVTTVDTFNDNKWHHVVITYNGNNNVVIYIDGVSQTLDSTTFTVHDISNQDLSIGADNSGQFYAGNLSNIRLFNVALTAEQVAELYDNPEQAVPTGVDATSLVLHLPMTEGAGSYVYNANANAIGTELISNAGFDETCQKWGTTDSSTVEIAGGKAIWTNAPLSGSFVEQPLDLEVGKFYRVKFDYTSTAFNIFVNLGNTQQAVPLGNGTFVYDMYYGSGSSSLKFKHGYSSNSSATVDNVSVKEVVPNYYNGTINGATWVTRLPEPLPQTALMDWNKGTNLLSYSESFETGWSYGNTSITADQTNAPNETFTADKSTVNSSNAYHDSLLKSVTTTSGVLYEVSIYAKKGEGINGIYFYQGNGSRIAKWNLNDGTYIGHAAGNSYNAYESYGSENAGNGWFRFWARYTASSSSGNFTVGISPNTSDSVVQYTGNGTDYLYIWGANYASSPTSQPSPYIRTEATAQTSPVLIQEGSTPGKDVFGNTISNPRASGAYNFDGNSWAEVQDNASTDTVIPMTIEAWVYNNTGELSSSNRYMPIFDKATGSNGASGFTLRVYSTNSANGGYIGIGGVFSAFNFTDGSYQHIVAVIEPSSQKIYINGSLQNSFTNSWTVSTNSSPLRIGYAPSDGEQWLYGQIANARVYNYALTADQVADNFNEKASTFGGTKVASELDAYIERTASDGATVEAHSCLVNYLTELDKK